MPTIDTAGDGTVRRFDGRRDTLQSRSLLPHIVTIVGLVIAGMIALSGLPRSSAAEQASDVPAWLQAHVGEGDGQIAPVVLQRARALYLQKVSEGAVKNPCYFAMDATRPAGFGRRFYIDLRGRSDVSRRSIGPRQRSQLAGANFTNGIRCAKNFTNAMDSKLTTGGAYVTDETITRFKGYYRSGAGKYVAFNRSFVQFDGEGDTANAQPRAIGGHPAAVLRVACRRKDPGQPVRQRGRLRSVRHAGGLRGRPQQRLHQLGRSRTPRKSSR